MEITELYHWQEFILMPMIMILLFLEIDIIKYY